MKTLKENGANATKLILAAVPELAKQDWSKTSQALKVREVDRGVDESGRGCMCVYNESLLCEYLLVGYNLS